jgi:hypothetical protein
MQQDINELRWNLSRLIEKCSESYVESEGHLDATEGKHAVNVQIALHDLGQDVNGAMAAAVWRHHSNSLMAGWMSQRHGVPHRSCKPCDKVFVTGLVR